MADGSHAWDRGGVRVGVKATVRVRDRDKDRVRVRVRDDRDRVRFKIRVRVISTNPTALLLSPTFKTTFPAHSLI